MPFKVLSRREAVRNVRISAAASIERDIVCDARLRESGWGGFQAPFPPAVAHRLRLSALAAAIA